MNGVSKRKSHRLLSRQLELSLSVPEIPHRQGAKILAAIRRKEAPPQTMHPCVKTQVSYTHCLRRYPETFDKRCSIQASKHSECLSANAHWEPDAKFEYLTFLEHLNVLSESRTYKKTDPQAVFKEGAAFLVNLGKRGTVTD